MSPIEVPAKIQLVEKRETRTSRGMLSKGWYHVNDQLVMVKGNSITEAGTAGYEPYSEVMASLIAQVLGLPHVEYALMPAKLFPDIQTYSCDVVSVCPKFTTDDEQLYHFADLADAHFLASGRAASPEALFQYAIELYGKKWLYQMLAFDAFIGNEDRHENNFDVIIAGCGAAGLYGAINLPASCRVLLVCKQELTLCNSALAQGGIAGVYKSPQDSIELHEHDTMVAGGFKNNPETLHILTTHAAHEIQAILDMGVDFDRTPDGELHRTLEGGHCRHRIFHHKDATGAEILDKLIRKVKTLPNVTILEHAMMVGMKKTGTGFSVNIMQGGSFTTYNSHFMLLATGGIGRVYSFTTNSKIATGDGIAFAYENGAEIRNLHLIQFHPTAFNDHHTRECFLISEAVRGEGAYLLNCKKERFMDRYDERLELAPRDVVSRSIILESRETKSDNFYLDISHKDPEFVRNRFPMIYEKVLEQGYDMTKEPIPIFPCQHYLMGGIQVDTNSETTIPNLYAAGECSHTGVHGNNRLASNSLLEALVFSRQAALDIAKKLPNTPSAYETAAFPTSPDAQKLPKGFRTEIRKIMQENYFVIPNKEKLPEGFRRIEEIRNQLLNGNYIVDADYVEAKSLATVAYIILKEVL